MGLDPEYRFPSVCFSGSSSCKNLIIMVSKEYNYAFLKLLLKKIAFHIRNNVSPLLKEMENGPAVIFYVILL